MYDHLYKIQAYNFMQKNDNQKKFPFSEAELLEDLDPYKVHSDELFTDIKDVNTNATFMVSMEHIHHKRGTVSSANEFYTHRISD